MRIWIYPVQKKVRPIVFVCCFVQAVPKTMVNESFSIEGSLPEERFLDEILRSVRVEQPSTPTPHGDRTG